MTVPSHEATRSVMYARMMKGPGSWLKCETYKTVAAIVGKGSLEYYCHFYSVCHSLDDMTTRSQLEPDSLSNELEPAFVLVPDDRFIQKDFPVNMNIVTVVLLVY
jgi:hypothetical protein